MSKKVDATLHSHLQYIASRDYLRICVGAESPRRRKTGLIPIFHLQLLVGTASASLQLRERGGHRRHGHASVPMHRRQMEVALALVSAPTSWPSSSILCCLRAPGPVGSPLPQGGRSTVRLAGVARGRRSHGSGGGPALKTARTAAVEPNLSILKKILLRGCRRRRRSS
jgi:hypothetical protein